MREACVSVTDYSFCKLNFYFLNYDLYLFVFLKYIFLSSFLFLSNKFIYTFLFFIPINTVLFLILFSYCKNDFTYTAFNLPASG